MRNAVVRMHGLVCGQILLFSGAGVAHATTPRYTLTDLGDLPGAGDSSTAYGINDYGQVVGSSLTSGGPRVGMGTRHATLWTPDLPNGTTGTLMDLGVFRSGPGATIVDDYSEAAGINDYGQVVGFSGATGFLWTPASPNGMAGKMTDIGNLGGFATEPKAINNRGQIVGWSHKPGHIESAFLWSPDEERGTVGRMIDLGLLPDAGDRAGATDVNDSGVVIGSSYSLDGHGFAKFLWAPTERNGMTGQMRRLTIDVAAEPPAQSFDARGINDAGLITGSVENMPRRALRMAPDGTVQLAPPVWIEDGLEVPTSGIDVNASGVVVGVAVGHGVEWAFVWHAAGEAPLDLKQLMDESGGGWVLKSANRINDLGQIVGDGLFDPDGNPTTRNSVPRAFLLTPLSLMEGSVPEPGVLSLVPLASAAGFVRRRRCRSRTGGC